MRQKTRNDVWGVKHSCINYDECPLCFGCRAYDPSYKKCEHCEKNSRRDICNKERHTTKAISLMLGRK